MFFKRGQLTIFIIIAILIIAVVALFFMFRGGIGFGKEKPVSPESAPIKNFVQECLDESLEDVVFQVGEGGGYYFPANAPAKTPVLEVPYYIKNNGNLMPSKKQIQDEISKYVKRELVLCLGNFALFSPEYEITKGEITSETIIELERVIVDVNYPLIIKKGESKSKIEDFNSEVPVRLGIVYDAVGEFVGQELATTEGKCAGCLLNMGIENNLYVNAINYNENTMIYIVTYIDLELNKEFVYIFANEYK